MSKPATQEAVGGPMEAALKYAERGWRVLPLYEPDLSKPSDCSCSHQACSSPGKHPRIGGGHLAASSDSEQIRNWWGLWPNANVGIATGDELLVVDVDPRNGGAESLDLLEVNNDRMDSYRVRTGSGGLHIYFQKSEPIRCLTGFEDGIDIKAEGGYVVAPPSRHVDGDYTVLDDRALAHVPRWLIQRLREGAGVPRAPASRSISQCVAPGEAVEERVRWTGHVVEAICHDDRFNDRGAWVGVAYAIRDACGPGGEEDAFEIFDSFSKRWPGEGAKKYDFDETRRVWDSLSPTSKGAGYTSLLNHAAAHHYALPVDHPWHAANMFELEERPPELEPPTADSELAAAIASLKATWTSADLVPQTTQAREALQGLAANDQPAFEAVVLSRINSVLRSFPATERFWRSLESGETAGTSVINGQSVIRAADPERISWDATHIVDGLIPANAVGEVIADYSTGKTMLLLDLALSVALDRPFLGRQTESGRVLYLAYEGQLNLWKRIATWLHHHGYLPARITAADLKRALSDRLIVAEVPPQFDHAAIRHLLGDSIRVYDVDLVIIDTRAKSLGRDQSEDSADSASTIQALLSEVAQCCAATFISAHHTGLKNKSRGRGSSAWTQGGDFAFTIDGTRADFERGKDMALKATKFRDGEWPPPVKYRLRSGIEVSIEGTDWSGAVIERIAPSIRLPLPARVFRAIQEVPECSSTAVRDMVEGANVRIDEAVQQLIKMGAIRDDPEGNRHRYSCEAGWEVELDGVVRHIGDAPPDSLRPRVLAFDEELVGPEEDEPA